MTVTPDTNEESILYALDDARVFNVWKLDDGRLCFEESCDNHFRKSLTKAEVLALADELRALADS